MKIESIEHARFRALAQILVSKEQGVEAFEEYMKVAFPYLEATKRRTHEQATQILKQEIGRGPIVVTPQQTTAIKSKLRQRVVSTAKPIDSKLYGKMGRSIPT